MRLLQEPTQGCWVSQYNGNGPLLVDECFEILRNALTSSFATCSNSKGNKFLPIEIVYGISITAMSFFTDPTISTLTSGTLSQNTDLGGLSFPRRLGVRFNQDFVRKDSLIGKQVVWSAYEDKNFTKKLEGKDFYHEDIVSRDGWAMYYFKGIFPGRVAYLKLEVLNDGMLMRELYFRFTKGFQNSLSGEQRIKDPITGEKIVLNGLMEELRPRKGKNGTVYTPGHLTFSDKKLMIASMSPEDLTYKGEDAIKPTTVETHAVLQTSVRYSEKPSAVFLVTPPHLMKYAKIILILVKQLVDLNFDKSYMTKSSQKPLYKTRFMLDELGKKLPAYL